MTRAERAKQLFLEGYNCSQAVLLAFSDLTGVNKETLKAVALPMGGGMGRMRLTCGGVSGAVMAIGLLFPTLSKNESYALVQEFAGKFRERNGSIICGELLTGVGVVAETKPVAEERTQAYYKKRPCGDLVYDAAEILEELWDSRKA